MVFQDRVEAGMALAEKLNENKPKNPVVFALPRGGVPVAYQVAKRIGANLDVIIVRKLGVPFNPEYAFGAIAPEGVVFLEQFVISKLGLDNMSIKQVVMEEKAEMERRIQKYRGSLDYPDLSQRVAIVIDDGVATGATALAAIKFIRMKDPVKIVFAAPVGASDSLEKISSIVDDVVCLVVPPQFGAVGMWYRKFGQTTDEEVLDALASANEEDERE